jgi:hypothetical protein
MSLGTISTDKLIVSAVYSASAFTLNPTGSTGSGLLDVRKYKTKTGFCNIYPSINGSGSLSISGSFDGTNMFYIYTGSVLNSGSTGQYSTVTDAIPFISVYLNNSNTGSQISGSLFLSAY